MRPADTPDASKRGSPGGLTSTLASLALAIVAVVLLIASRVVPLLAAQLETETSSSGSGVATLPCC